MNLRFGTITGTGSGTVIEIGSSFFREWEPSNLFRVESIFETIQSKLNSNLNQPIIILFRTQPVAISRRNNVWRYTHIFWNVYLFFRMLTAGTITLLLFQLYTHILNYALLFYTV